MIFVFFFSSCSEKKENNEYFNEVDVEKLIKDYNFYDQNRIDKYGNESSIPVRNNFYIASNTANSTSQVVHQHFCEDQEFNIKGKFIGTFESNTNTFKLQEFNFKLVNDQDSKRKVKLDYVSVNIAQNGNLIVDTGISKLLIGEQSKTIKLQNRLSKDIILKEDYIINMHVKLRNSAGDYIKEPNSNCGKLFMIKLSEELKKYSNENEKIRKIIKRKISNNSLEEFYSLLWEKDHFCTAIVIK